MESADSILELLRSHEGAWEPDVPAMEAEIAGAEQTLGHAFPPSYRALLGAGGGAVYGENGRVLFFPAKHLDQFTPEERAPELKGMLLFGDDEGDYFYYFDPENRLGRGAWAVYAVEKGTLDLDYSIFSARDLHHLIERILAGDAVAEGPFLKDN